MIDVSANLRAAGLTVAAMALFSISDGVVKLLTAAYPPGQILFCRGVFAIGCLLLVARLRQPGPVRLPWRDRAIWLRSFCEFGVAMCFLRALAALPLAEATAILFVFPVLLTAFAAIFLGEQVGWRRWLAVGCGLLGAIVMLRPGSAAFTPAALWALGAAVLVAGRDLLTRHVSPAARSETVALMTTILVTVASLATAPFGWSALDGPGMAGFAASSVLVSAAFICLVEGTRTGDVSFTAPFRYVIVPLSFLIGFLIWGHVPDAPVLIGTGIVVGSGLFVFHRERRRRAAPLPART